MADNRISKKPKIARQYELSQQAIVDSSIDQGGSPVFLSISSLSNLN